MYKIFYIIYWNVFTFMKIIKMSDMQLMYKLSMDYECALIFKTSYDT